MKNCKVYKLLLLIVLSTLATTNVFAHTALSEAVPSDGAMIMQSPENLQLKFTEDVRLLKVAVMLGENEIDIEFEPSATASRQFSVTLPKLEHGHYSVAWSVMGADSHRVEGNLSFMVGMMGDHQGEHGDAGQGGHDQHSDQHNASQSGRDH